jgi:plasmid stabilization system protein ParE
VRRVRLLASAKDDLAAIGDYIQFASGSRRVAARFVRELNDYCRYLGRLPGTLGRARPELSPDIRSAPYGNYIVFFRYVGDVVEIVNVIERHRDIEALFRKSEE